jgi:hypothetical protein
MVFDSIPTLSSPNRFRFEHQGLLWCLANSNGHFDKQAHGYRYTYSEFMPCTLASGILRYLRSIGAKRTNEQVSLTTEGVELSVSYEAHVFTIDLLQTEGKNQ